MTAASDPKHLAMRVFFLGIVHCIIIISLHTQACMHNSIAVSESEVCCSYRVGVAIDAVEIIVGLSGDSMKKIGRGK